VVNLVDVARQIREQGQPMTAAALGGQDAVLTALAGAAGTAGGALLAEVVLIEWAAFDSERAVTAIMAVIRAELDPLGYEEIVDAIFESPAGLASLAEPLQEEVLSRFGQRQDHRAAGMAGLALDALLRLALVRAVTPWRFFAALESVGPTEPDHLLIALVRRLGALYTHLPTARSLVKERLAALSQNDRLSADITFETAHTELVDALEADTRTVAERYLRSARSRFIEAVQHDANRADAELLATALDAVLGMVDGQSPAELEEHAGKIRELALLRQAWQGAGRLSWLAAENDVNREWWALSRALYHAAAANEKDPWLQPTVMLEQFANALRVSETARLLPVATETPGLRSIVVPALRMPFAEDVNRKALLSQWVEEFHSESGTALLREVETEDPKGGADSVRAKLIRELGSKTVNGLTTEQCLSLLNQLYARDQRKIADAPTIRRVMDDIRSRLRNNGDYQGDVRYAFDLVLKHTLRFLHDRMNIQLSGKRMEYLADPNALEDALQQDYREWMAGNGLNGILDIEVGHVAAGRIDVRFTFGTDRIITEVKRDEAPFNPGGLDKHLNQAGAYQVSNVRLGILLVLDLSDKSAGQGRSFERSVWVTPKPVLEEGDLPRDIVVVVVPGNRPRRPSQVKAKVRTATPSVQ
jgi:hypothetical protein